METPGPMTSLSPYMSKRRDGKRFLDLVAQLFGPGFGSEYADFQFYRTAWNLQIVHHVRHVERVRGG